MADQLTGRNQGKRDPKTGRFVKGNHSGGRPSLKGVKALLSSYEESACRLIGETVSDEEAPLKYRIMCAKEILDRLYGKPKQNLDVSGPEDGAFGVVIMPEVRGD